MKLVDFDNSFIEQKSYDDNAIADDDAIARVFIDGYPEDEYGEGEVVAEVILTEHCDIVIAWHRNDYRFNDTVKELIEDSKKQLQCLYDNTESLDECPCDNCFLHGDHESYCEANCWILQEWLESEVQE